MQVNNFLNLDFEEIEKAVWEDARKLIEPSMEKAKARLADVGLNDDDIILKIVTGVPSRAKALVEEAKNANCGSIIVGRTGISRVEDFNIGRVCQKVLHRAKDIVLCLAEVKPAVGNQLCRGLSDEEGRNQ